jgi:tripartite ATP-independent transporter DctP family solute receptor
MRLNRRFQSPITILAIFLIPVGFNMFSMAEAVTLKFGHYSDDNSVLGKTARQFAQTVEERTDGQIRIEVHPGSQLGPPQRMLTDTQKNRIDITLAPVIFLRSFAPKMDVLELPFLIRNYSEADVILRPESRFSQQLLGDLEPGNLKGLAFWEIGFRAISTSRQPIEDPLDLKGLKIRTYPNQALMQALALLGADPVEVPAGELFEALQHGAIDGQEGLIDTFYRLKLYETQKYLCYTRHLYSTLVLVMNSQRFADLEPRQQRFVIESAFEAAASARNNSRDLENHHIERLREMDVQIEMDPDWDGFRKRVFYEVQEKFVREDGRKLLKEIEGSLR